jgi:hypothetical protein
MLCNTTLKVIAGGLTTIGRGTIQLIIKQENQGTTILLIDNVICTPECPYIVNLKQKDMNIQASQQTKTQQLYFTGEIITPPKNQNTNNKLHNTPCP